MTRFPTYLVMDRYSRVVAIGLSEIMSDADDNGSLDLIARTITGLAKASDEAAAWDEGAYHPTP